MEKQPSLQFLDERLQSIALLLIPLGLNLGLSIASTLWLDRYLTHGRIWEVIIFNFGISLAISTILITISGCILSTMSNGIMNILAFLFWYGSFWCVIVGGCLGIVSGAVSSIISIGMRLS